MKNITKMLSIAFIAAIFTGCAAIKSPIDDGYEFGDITKSTLSVQAKYCSETDPVQRAMMLTAIKSAFPEFPASGACTELYKVIDQEKASEIASQVNIEQAIEDQKKFQNK